MLYGSGHIPTTQAGRCLGPMSLMKKPRLGASVGPGSS